MLKTTDTRLDFLGVVPTLQIQDRLLDAQTLAALSALLTFKGKSIQDLYTETVVKEQDLDSKVVKILEKSSLRGHASIATTPVISLSFQGSKFLDALLTPLVFASGLMASGRRTGTTVEDIVFPSAIAQSPEASRIYQEASSDLIQLVNDLLEGGLRKDEVTKMLPYGIAGTGIVTLSVESLVALFREYEREREWMPEDAGLFLEEIREKAPELGIDVLYATRCSAPKDIYPFPNVFKNPARSNLARDLRHLHRARPDSVLVGCEVDATPSFLEQIHNLSNLRDQVIMDQDTLTQGWYGYLGLREEICRDFLTAARVRILSSPSWRVWGEKKRHRTVPMICDSLYYGIGEAAQIFRKIDNINSPTAAQVEEVDTCFSLPPSVKADPNLLGRWLQCAQKSFAAYDRLSELVHPRDSLYVVPRGVRVDVVQDYNLYNLISGYFPLRLCSTAEEQMQAMTRVEARLIRQALEDKGVRELGEHMVPKCQVVGFCPEEKYCGHIKQMVTWYDEEIHGKLKKELEARWKATLV